MVEIESGHCYCWMLKQLGHDFFHDYYWILKHSGLGSLNSQDMISQVSIYVMDIVWILYDVYV